MEKCKKIIPLIIFLCLIFLITGCNTLHKSVNEEGSLKIIIKSNSEISLQSVSDHIQLSKFIVTVSNGSDTITQEAAFTGNTQEIVFNNLSIGEWNINVIARDINNYDCYGGSATATVTDTANIVEVPLYLLNGDLDVNVILPDVQGLNITSGVVKLINPLDGSNTTLDLTLDTTQGFADFGSVKAGTWYMEVELYDNGTLLAWGSGTMTVFPGRDNTAIIEFTDTIQGGELRIIVIINESPSDPTGLTGTYENGSIILSWNANPEPDIAGYVVYRANSETDFKKILTYTLITDTTFTDTNVEPEKTYYYWVQAYNINGYSSELSGPCIVKASNASGPIQIDLSQYSSVIYVDINNGDDVNGDGSEINPYKTIPVAFENAIIDNTAIYIVGAGTYAIPDGLHSILKTDLKVDYIVDPAIFGQVIFDLQSIVYYVEIKMTKYNNFIGIVFIRTTGGDSRTYEYFFDTSEPKINLYNCVFDIGTIAANTFPIFPNNSVGYVKDIYYYNCSFMPDFTIKDDGATHCKGNFTNCAFITPDFTTDSYNLCGVTFDTDYQITSEGWQYTGTGYNPDGSPANIGVYGGTYAWGLW